MELDSELRSLVTARTPAQPARTACTAHSRPGRKTRYRRLSSPFKRPWVDLDSLLLPSLPPSLKNRMTPKGGPVSIRRVPCLIMQLGFSVPFCCVRRRALGFSPSRRISLVGRSIGSESALNRRGCLFACKQKSDKDTHHISPEPYLISPHKCVCAFASWERGAQIRTQTQTMQTHDITRKTHTGARRRIPSPAAVLLTMYPVQYRVILRSGLFAQKMGLSFSRRKAHVKFPRSGSTSK